MTWTNTASGAGPCARRRSRLFGSAIGCVLTVLVLTGCGAHPSSYGTLPTYLPVSSIQPDSELTGTAARPALTTEGDSVHVELAAASVHATVSGPVVPGEGLPVVQNDTTCTWTVTLTGASRAVPVRAADFTAIDHLGKVYRAAFVPGQPRPPGTLAPGQKTTFELRAVMASGEGLMRWAPEHSIVASWDFEVEND